MPFLDHLEELRWRLLYSLGAIVICTILGWVVVDRIDIIGVLIRPIEPLLPAGRLAFTSPVDPLMIQLKFAFLVGLVLASPVVGYNLWAFLAPALYDREKRMIVPSLVVGALLFMGGALAGYALVLPRALKVLFGFQSAHLAPVITADRYFGFAFQLILAFGVVTELPLVVTILASLGLVTPGFLSRNRRYALVVAAALAAFLTPPDAVSMLMMMVPLLLLYEIGIFCAWVVTRRRARAAAAAGGGTGGVVKAGLLILALLGGGGGGRLKAQVGQPPPPPPPGQDTTRFGQPGVGGGAANPVHPLDTAAARKLGLPSAPSRNFPTSDAVIDSLLKLKGYRITQYVADTLLLLGDSQTIFLRGEAFVDREGTKLQADSVRYRESDCRLDATGTPQLFDQGQVMVGDGMRYDTCEKRGTVQSALTDFQNGGATWLMRGNLAVDSGSTRLYGAKSNITSSDLPVPDYHFEARQVKWVNKTVMVARPAILYVRDVPIMWLPFIFQDIRPGRRSGILIPRFGLNDIVRPTRNYHRHIANLGYYWVVNDYVDALASADWFAGTSFTVRAQTRYRWLDQFVSGGFSYSHLGQLDTPATSDQIMWNHNQQFSSRTRFTAAVNYATNGRVVQNNTVDPFLTTAQLSSQANFDKRFDWGTFNAGASLTQNLSTKLTTQNFPRVTLTPAPIDIGPSVTWSPGFSFNNSQTLHNGPTLVPTAFGPDTVIPYFFDNRSTDIAFRTPLRIGRWNWDNGVTIADRSSNQRYTLAVPDSTDPSRLTNIVYGRTFATAFDWTTAINLPQLFSGTWHLQPGVSIVNTTSAGPFLIRNQYSGGQFVSQGKRLQFSVGLAPTFFGFFPGFGPLARIRHSFSPLISYQMAPGATVPQAYAHAIDPTGRLLNSRSDPQQTMNVGLQQAFEGKLKPPPGDTTTAAASRKVRLLSWSTSPMSYNFEQAKQAGRTGWQTQTMTNTFASDLLRGFSLQLTHDLWTGQAGLASSRFSPFLTNVSASFTVTARTFQGLGALIGLGHLGNEPPAPQAQPGQQGTLPGQVPQGPGPRGRMDLQSPYAVGAGAGAGGGFSMSLQFTSTRTRVYETVAPPPTDIGLGLPPPPPLPPPSSGLSGGRSQLSMNTHFNPTVNWSVSWNTIYDFDLKQFGQQFIRLERNLRRWHASFVFSRTASGNFAFNFYVALLDEPDIKFDYDQQTFAK